MTWRPELGPSFFSKMLVDNMCGYLLDLPDRLTLRADMAKILVSGTVLMVATCVSLLVFKRGRLFGRSSNHIMISFDQFKARELEKR